MSENEGDFERRYRKTKEFARAAKELNDETELKTVGRGVNLIRVGLAALAVKLYRKVTGNKDA